MEILAYIIGALCIVHLTGFVVIYAAGLIIIRNYWDSSNKYIIEFVNHIYWFDIPLNKLDIVCNVGAFSFMWPLTIWDLHKEVKQFKQEQWISFYLDVDTPDDMISAKYDRVSNEVIFQSKEYDLSGCITLSKLTSNLKARKRARSVVRAMRNVQLLNSLNNLKT